MDDAKDADTPFTASDDRKFDNEDTKYIFRSTLAQVLASTGTGFIVLGVGLIFAMPMIVIGGLRNATDGFVLTEEDASWFGSIVFISQPIGSIASGFLQDIFGRKVCMMAINVPQFVAWIIIYKATSVGMLYTAVAMMGLSVGFMEAPVLSYIGEVTQPHLRGIMSSVSCIFVSVGLLLECLLGALLHWRTMAAYSSIAPAVTFALLSLFPDSPAWLVYKGKVKKAERALCWLRGWVSSQQVQKEMSALISHIEEKGKIRIVSTSDGEYKLVPLDDVKDAEKQQTVEHKSGAMQNMRYLLRPEVQRPLRLVLVYFFCSHCAALMGMRPFFIQIFDDLRMPISSNWIVVFGVSLQLAGSIVLMMVLKKTGKRYLSFLSMGVCSFSAIALGVYTSLSLQLPWVALMLFSAVYFMSACGIGPIPWILISEVFPLQGRGLAGGVSAAACYTFAFVVTKSFIDLKAYLHLPGTFYLYGIVGLIGLVYLYFRLPETEGKSLKDIETYFAKKKKNISV